mmetsp:Transcript_20556/g.66590  ORF Transcript_20556/g.66590 Transcript_20556/m.66590 type:complete len:1005 (+) Transcript_20556:90-3104(+)
MKFSSTLVAFVLGSLAVAAVAAVVEPASGRNVLAVEASHTFSLLRGTRGAAEALVEEGEAAAEGAMRTARRADYAMWIIIGGCVLVGVAAICGAVAVVLKKMSGGDTSVVLHKTYDVPAGKFQAFKDHLRNFYGAIQPAAEGLLYYGFTFDEDDVGPCCKVVCKVAFKDAAGVLKHMDNVNASLNTVATIGNLVSMEALGPDAELKKLKPKLTELGAKFYTFDSGCKLYGACIPKAWNKRAIDTSMTLRNKFKVPEGKLDEFVAIFPEFDGSIRPEAEAMLNFGFAVDKENGFVVSHESYKDVAGLLLHLENVDGAFKKALEIATLESMEVHGPVNELCHVKSALSPHGCQFFGADPNCKTWTWAGGDLAAIQDKDMSASDIFQTTGKRMLEQFQEKMEAGSRSREIVETEVNGFQEKAKVFLINELNSTAKALLKAVDEEEASMLLEFNQSVESSFPPFSVLLAGVMSPAILGLSVVGHFVQLFGLFLPIALGTGWAAWEDFGSHCDIPTMAGWTYFTFATTLLLVLAHGILGFTLYNGQKALKAKNQEITDRLAHNAADGDTSVSDMQEIFIGSTVLVQEALLLEDSVKRSFWRTLIGPCTLLWMIAVIWNFVLVVGWTFVPGQISFYAAAGEASKGAFCGSWASVFVARVVVLLTPLFFFINFVAIIQWVIVTLLNSEAVSSAVLSAAQDFDNQNTGIPVVEILMKAVLLRGSEDIYPAKLTVALGEALRLSQEQRDLEAQLKDVESKILMGESQRQAMESAAEKNGANIQENLEILEKVGEDDMLSWKTRGQELAKEAERKAGEGGKIATDELDKIATYATELAAKIRNSEMYKDAVEAAKRASEQAQIAAAKAAEEAAAAAIAAQEMAAEGLAQAQAGIDAAVEYAQSDEAQAALVQAKGMAQQRLEEAQDAAKAGIEYAQSEEAQAAFAKAKDKAQQKLTEAQDAAKAGIEYAQSQEAQAAVKKASEQAQSAATTAAAQAQSSAAGAASGHKKKGGKK